MKGYPEETLVLLVVLLTVTFPPENMVLNLIPDNTAIVEGFECGASF